MYYLSTGLGGDTWISLASPLVLPHPKCSGKPLRKISPNTNTFPSCRVGGIPSWHISKPILPHSVFPPKKAAPLGWPFWNSPIVCSQVTGVFASMYQALKSMWALHVAALSYELQAARGIDGIQIAEPQGLRGRWWQGLEFFSKTLESQPRFSCILIYIYILYRCHSKYVYIYIYSISNMLYIGTWM